MKFRRSENVGSFRCTSNYD